MDPTLSALAGLQNALNRGQDEDRGTGRGHFDESTKIVKS
jgi:hypothetical protein